MSPMLRIWSRSLSHPNVRAKASRWHSVQGHFQFQGLTADWLWVVCVTQVRRKLSAGRMLMRCLCPRQKSAGECEDIALPAITVESAS